MRTNTSARVVLRREEGAPGRLRYRTRALLTHSGLRVELQNPPAGPTSAASASKYTVAIFTNDKCSGTPGGQSTGVALGCTSSAADKTSFSLGVTSTGGALWVVWLRGWQALSCKRNSLPPLATVLCPSAYTVTIFAGGVDCPAAGGLPFTTGQLGTCQKDAVAGAACVVGTGVGDATTMRCHLARSLFLRSPPPPRPALCSSRAPRPR